MARTKEEVAATKRKWQVANSKKIAVYTRKYQAAHRSLLNERGRSWHWAHREKILARAHARRIFLRLSVLAHYGGKCKCCGEDRLEFLAIDHINGGGHKHRKSVGSGEAFYRWLIKNGYPEGYQVLCHNCNTAKETYGYCPHQRQERKNKK